MNQVNTNPRGVNPSPEDDGEFGDHLVKEFSQTIARLMSIEQVATALNVSTTSITRWWRAKDSDFPAPLQIGGRYRWNPEEIRTWIDNRVRAGGVRPPPRKRRAKRK